jgi:hypothetical protein
MQNQLGTPRTRCAISLIASLMLCLAASAGAVAEQRGPTPAAKGAEVYFVDLKDGATVPPKFTVYFGLRNMGVAPAGSDLPNSGHHHLLIDTELPPLNEPIPNDFNHLHFGAGQTQAEVNLKPGDHTLQLLFGDKDHIPHSPPVMSARIHIHVADGGAPAPASAAAQTGGPTPAPKDAAVYFIDLKDGATVPSKLTVYFGLRGMGVAPAGSDRPNSGHHHLLIDTDLPPLDQPIPNDFNHLHFGAGQTQADIELKPGDHTLQLLFGDKDHIPHTPPVMSSLIHVHVAPPKPPRKPSPPGATVFFIGLEDGAVLPATTTLHFGLTNMGVAPAGIARPNTGHHHLLIDTSLPPMDEPIPSDFHHLHFGAGQTEAKIQLPLGEHTLQLLLGDENHVPHDPPVMSKPIRVTVTPNGKRPETRSKR